MLDELPCDRPTWLLVYTKPHAEAWAQANMKRQGFATVLPWVGTSSGMRPLFPRYFFVGHLSSSLPPAIRNTYGVQYIVMCGEKPARVPSDVIAEIQSRMDARDVVHLDRVERIDPLFAKRERERVRALVKFAQAGFRVRAG